VRTTDVLAVVVDPPDRNAQVAADVGLDYRILSDADLRVIDAYDLRHDDPASGLSIARPASFLLDANGVVRWRDLTDNYRYRPHPDAILAAIDALGAAPASR